MSETPEGAVKKQVKAFLRERKVASLSAPVNDAVGYYHMYVPSGYGDPALDFTGCYRSKFFSIETKARGNTPSARQKIIITRISDAGGLAIWGDDADDICKRLSKFFDFVDAQ